MAFSWGSVDWGAVAGAAASAYGASQASKAAKQAGNQAAQGATEANALQKYIYDDQRALQQPFYDGGLSAYRQFQQGLQPQTDYRQWMPDQLFDMQNGAPTVNATAYATNPAYKQAWDEVLKQHTAKYGGGYTQASNPDALRAALTQSYQQKADPFAAFRSAPGYQAGLDQGRKTVEASAAARGGLNSGATLKALTKFASDYQDQGYTGYMNKLASLWGGAQTASNQMGQAGQNYAGQVGQNFQNAANARAQSTYASGQAWQDGIANMAYFGGRAWDKYKGGA